MSTLTAGAGPGGPDPASTSRVELACLAAVVEVGEILAEQLQTLAPAVEDELAALIWPLGTAWDRRARVIVAVTVALAVAAWVGSLFGSGVFSPDERFNAERLSAQEGQVAPYGPAEVYGHPGAERGVERQDLIRQFMELDRTN